MTASAKMTITNNSKFLLFFKGESSGPGSEWDQDHYDNVVPGTSLNPPATLTREGGAKDRTHGTLNYAVNEPPVHSSLGFWVKLRRERRDDIHLEVTQSNDGEHAELKFEYRYMKDGGGWSSFRAITPGDTVEVEGAKRGPAEIEYRVSDAR